MSMTNGSTSKADASLTRDVIGAARYYLWRAARWARPRLGRPRNLILLAMAVVAAGAWLNWSWLVAVGLAPVLLTLAPCAVMCALGLCMGARGKSCAPDTTGSAKPRDEP